MIFFLLYTLYNTQSIEVLKVLPQLQNETFVEFTATEMLHFPLLRIFICLRNFLSVLVLRGLENYSDV